MARKRRTREHVLGDLGVNHVERHALLCGFSVEHVRSDYGVDLVVFTYDARGWAENGCLFLQVKATERPRWVEGGGALAFTLDKRDLERWLNEIWPVVLVVYDVPAEQAYWLYLQRYFATRAGFSLSKLRRSVVVRIAKRQTLTPGAMRRLAAYRDSVLGRLAPMVDHG